MATTPIDHEKASVEHVEQMSDHSDPHHPDIYKAMRLDGDGEDHMTEPPVRVTRSVFRARDRLTDNDRDR